MNIDTYIWNILAEVKSVHQCRLYCPRLECMYIFLYLEQQIHFLPSELFNDTCYQCHIIFGAVESMLQGTRLKETPSAWESDQRERARERCSKKSQFGNSSRNHHIAQKNKSRPGHHDTLAARYICNYNHSFVHPHIARHIFRIHIIYTIHVSFSKSSF